VSFSIIHSGFRMIQAPPPPAIGVDYLYWTPDPAAAAHGVTGYEIGIRTSANPPGTYPNIIPVDGPNSFQLFLSDIIPPLASGTYVYAVRSVGTSTSAWSTELSFNV